MAHTENSHIFAFPAKITIVTFSAHALSQSNPIIASPEDWPFILSKKAFKSYLQQYELYPEERMEDVINFFAEYHQNIVDLFDLLVTTINSFKVQFCLACTFRKEVENTITYTLGYFVTENHIITAATDKNLIINRVVESLENKANDFEGLGSGGI